MFANLNLSEELKERISRTSMEERFSEKFPSASPEALDLLRRLITYSPSKRIQTDEGLQHAYCNQFHDPATELVASFKVARNPDDAELGVEREVVGVFEGSSVSDNYKLKTQQYREMLYGICQAQASGRKGPRRA